MCLAVKTPYKEDAAQVLSDLIYHSGYMPEGLRELIRENWPRVCQLAHQVHDEETGPDAVLQRAAKAIAALDERGIMNVVKGTAGSKEVVASFKLLAEEVLKPKVC